ncbi:hypothetical protein ILYODFUR_028048 [Ilyodon furcidens]|uniref:Uncharacterized protein n=1 Tax=Ilyodon furcidens TaxID=33524 RepID=A0ABV0U206_9TELE
MPLTERVSGTPGARLHPTAQGTALRSHDSFLCSLKSTGVKPYNPEIVEDVHLENTFVPEVILPIWLKKSAISRELYDRLCGENPLLIEAQCRHIAFSRLGTSPSEGNQSLHPQCAGWQEAALSCF